MLLVRLHLTRSQLNSGVIKRYHSDECAKPVNVDRTVIARLKELIQRGDAVLATRRDPPSNSIGFDSRVDGQLAHQWFTSVQNILARVFGEKSEHYRNFSMQSGTQGLSYSPTRRALGVLKAALEDYEQGYLFNLRELVEAEVFSDLLDQARALLAAGYFMPAAVLVGAVLEDALRRLALRADIELPEIPKLDRVNAQLAKAGLYSKLAQKRITAIADIRNSAAHGDWTAFSADDVNEMHAWVSRFLEEHL
jgi:hypothetical protein